MNCWGEWHEEDQAPHRREPGGAEARERGLTADERLRLHQQRSRPVTDRLHAWLDAQLDERKTEPNSGLGQAITYLLRHWQPLTLFLRKARARLITTSRKGP